MASPGLDAPSPWSGSVVRVVGDVDMSTAPALRNLFDRSRSEADLLVDLSGVTFMDAAGLNALLQARAQRDGRLAVRAPPRSLRRMLVVLQLQDAFTIVDGDGAGN